MALLKITKVDFSSISITSLTYQRGKNTLLSKLYMQSQASMEKMNGGALGIENSKKKKKKEESQISTLMPDEFYSVIIL